MWSWPFSLKGEWSMHVLTDSIAFYRCEGGLWGVCILFNLFFASACRPSNHQQNSIQLTDLFLHVTLKDSKDMGIKKYTKQKRNTYHASYEQKAQWCVIRHGVASGESAMQLCHMALYAFACCGGCHGRVACIIAVCICAAVTWEGFVLVLGALVLALVLIVDVLVSNTSTDNFPLPWKLASRLVRFYCFLLYIFRSFSCHAGPRWLKRKQIGFANVKMRENAWRNYSSQGAWFLETFPKWRFTKQ